MSSRQFSLTHHLLNLNWEIKESQGICDCRSRLRQCLSELFLGKPVLINQLPVTLSFFDGRQVRTLQVLDESEFEHILVRDILNNNWKLLEASYLCSLIAALTSDNLIALTNFADKEWLQDSVLLNRVRKFF